MLCMSLLYEQAFCAGQEAVVVSCLRKSNRSSSCRDMSCGTLLGTDSFLCESDFRYERTVLGGHEYQTERKK